jgi:hypothetical protein
VCASFERLSQELHAFKVWLPADMMPYHCNAASSNEPRLLNVGLQLASPDIVCCCCCVCSYVSPGAAGRVRALQELSQGQPLEGEDLAGLKGRLAAGAAEALDQQIRCGCVVGGLGLCGRVGGGCAWFLFCDTASCACSRGICVMLDRLCVLCRQITFVCEPVAASIASLFSRSAGTCMHLYAGSADAGS